MSLGFEHIQWAFLVLASIYVLTESTIFAPVRVFLSRGSLLRRAFIYCPMCTGFWIGVFYALLGYWPIDYGADVWPTLLECFESGCGGLVIGLFWSAIDRVHPGHAFVQEAELRGEDPETFMPRRREEDADDDQA